MNETTRWWSVCINFMEVLADPKSEAPVRTEQDTK